VRERDLPLGHYQKYPRFARLLAWAGRAGVFFLQGRPYLTLLYFTPTLLYFTLLYFVLAYCADGKTVQFFCKGDLTLLYFTTVLYCTGEIGTNLVGEATRCV
jgi:hypothetical protein